MTSEQIASALADARLGAVLAEEREDRKARVLEAWTVWRADPHSYMGWVAFEAAMAEYVIDLRQELAAAGWRSARAS